MWKKIKKFFFPCFENNYSPKILEGDFIFYWGLLILFLKVTLFPFYLYLPSSPFFAEIVKSVLIDLANKTRIELGLPPLKENPILTEAATLKAQDMLLKDYFAHKSPEGFYAWDLLKKLGYGYKIAGENLAIGYLDSEEVHQAWLASPSHRANILNPQYQEIGLAVSKGEFEGNEVYVVVQIFGTPQIIQPKTQTERVEISQKETLLPTPTIPKTEVLPAQTEKKPEETETPKPEMIAETKPTESEEFPTTTYLAEVQSKESENQKSFSFKILKFLAANYNNFVQKFVYGSLILIIFLLLLTIFIKIDVQYPSLIFKTLSFIILLAFFLWLDKEYILQIVAPHQLLIF